MPGQKSVVFAMTLLSLSAQGEPDTLTLKRLAVEYRANPIGIDATQPRLSWILESSKRNQRQTAYQILVDDGSTWDSGKVSSNESLHIVYQGNALEAGRRVHWKVRVWDQDDRASDWSEPAFWEMGLIKPDDWSARWITRKDQKAETSPSPLLRTEFDVAKKIVRARAYVSGLGYYELRLNGERVGDHVLDPGWTAYSKRVLYSTFDVTEQLKTGRNAVGIMLGNGWFNPVSLRMWGSLDIRKHLTVGDPRAILQLKIEFDDGSTQFVVSDENWKVADGPIMKNSVYLGEEYDARKEQEGWDRPGFDDREWRPVSIADAPGPLRAQDLAPIRVTRILKTVQVTEPRPGIFIFDLGQNFAGWVRLRVKGEPGTRIVMRFGELLNPDGTLNGLTSVCGQIKGGDKTAWQKDAYTLKGRGEETYIPRFTFHGFRYVEVTGFPGTPSADAIEGHRLNSDVPCAGEFRCSNPLFNRIQDMVRWTLLSNLFSVQSDCPHREKFGYGGDIVACSEMAMLNFDMERFYAKAVQDLADAARKNGGFTETAPFVGIADQAVAPGAGPVEWGTAHPLLLWQLYQYYGDRRILEEHYPAACRWLELLESKAKDGILDNGIGDHESLAPKSRALTGTGFYYLNAVLLSRIAGILERTEDAKKHSALAESIKESFNRAFLKPASGQYDIATQCCQSLALYLNLVPAEEKDKALQVLVKDVREKHQDHLTTGFFGTKFMLSVLPPEIAFSVVNQKTFPGWGHAIEKGATTLWEHWEFSDNIYSHNHPAFGSVSEWFIKVLAGINPDPAARGFDTIVIRPRPVGDLTWASGRYESVRGAIVSEWKLEKDLFSLGVTLPPNTTATVYVPAKRVEDVDAGDAQFLRFEGHAALYKVGSGTWRFTSSSAK